MNKTTAAIDINSVDRDINALREACEALQKTSIPRRRATLEFLWDKYVTNADPGPVEPGER